MSCRIPFLRRDAAVRVASPSGPEWPARTGTPPWSKRKPYVSDRISMIVLQYICLLFSLSIHEASHAATANYWGDPTARLMGRMTLNPIKHADLMGTVILPLFAMISGFSFLFGWAKPVPFNPRNLTDRRRGPVYIALAGPGSNLLVLIFSIAVLRALSFLPASETTGLFITAMLFLLMINAVLLLFNLIPLPPLDGHHVLEYFLPYEMQKQFEKIGPYSLIILFFLVFWLDILRVPMDLMFKGALYCAFYGTPIWGEGGPVLFGG